MSIVAYDDVVDLIQKSGSVANKAMLKGKVAQLFSRGSTNLSGGMLEGYAQVKGTFKENYVNRVLLLSDGLANAGIVDNAELLKIVKAKYESNNIALSAFGVGADYNEDLMTNLAEAGKGNYYFIDQADKIPTIFKSELEGLLSVVAQNTKISIDIPTEQMEVVHVYGYEYEVEGRKLMIDFNDVFGGEEKSVLVKLKAKEAFNEKASFSFILNYDDLLQDYERQTVGKTIALTATTDGDKYKMSFNENVTKNKVLYIANKRYEDATKAVDKGDYRKAEELLKENEVYLLDNNRIVEMDSTLIKQSVANDTYLKDLKDIERKSEYERKIMQKSGKNKGYIIKKKK